MTKTYHITTSKECFKDITASARETVTESGVRNGICVVSSVHTTAGITINENSDPAVVHDMLMTLDEMFPKRADYLHDEGNSDAHLKTSYMGNSVTVPIADGRLVLGIWQAIYFCEFDGPRQRRFCVTVIGE